MIPVVVMSQIAGKVMTATGRYKIFPVLGAGFLIAGTALLATMTVHTSRTMTSCYMALIGVGLGFTMQMATTIAQNSVGMRDMGAASAATNLFRTLGGSVGVAVFGTLFTNAVAGRVEAAYLDGVTTGIRHIFLGTAIVCAVALLAAVFLKEVALRGAPAAGVPAPQQQTALTK
jgi:MFS family permease